MSCGVNGVQCGAEIDAMEMHRLMAAVVARTMEIYALWGAIIRQRQGEKDLSDHYFIHNVSWGRWAEKFGLCDAIKRRWRSGQLQFISCRKQEKIRKMVGKCFSFRGRKIIARNPSILSDGTVMVPIMAQKKFKNPFVICSRSKIQHFRRHVPTGSLAKVNEFDIWFFNWLKFDGHYSDWLILITISKKHF